MTAKIVCLGVLLTSCVLLCHGQETDEHISYARIELPNPSNSEDVLTMTGVYAMFSPIKDVVGVLMPADPLDGCSKLKIPKGYRKGIDVVFLTRLSPNSTCTAIEQGNNAANAGAVGVINMAPEPDSSYIWILQQTRRDVVLGRVPSGLPHVAVSGVSGGRLYDVVKRQPTTVRVLGDTIVQQQLLEMDLAITIVCITVAILVLLYAYRVGRSICLSTPVYEEETEDPELRDRLRQRVSEILLSDLPAEKFSPPTDADTEAREGQMCAVCLDPMLPGSDIRKLTCDHFFHTECIDPWLLDHHNCPLCKDDIISPRKRSTEGGENHDQDRSHDEHMLRERSASDFILMDTETGVTQEFTLSAAEYQAMVVRPPPRNQVRPIHFDTGNEEETLPELPRSTSRSSVQIAEHDGAVRPSPDRVGITSI